ncbi:hypothetical protein Btru_008181 [Bulinus truncatus]|nr:hypothetical protein Btru_008181 [Bulinus truncatus]
MLPLHLIVSVFYVSNVVASSNGLVSETMHDVLGSLQNIVGSFTDYVGDRNGCHFQCQKGLKPYPNPKHVPSTNGCGSFGLKFDSHIKIKDVTKCCDEHDYCYDTCNKSKEKCDSNFKKCLTGLCNTIKDYLSKKNFEACKQGADMMYAATVALGCKPYKDSQANACIFNKIEHFNVYYN